MNRIIIPWLVALVMMTSTVSAWAVTDYDTLTATLKSDCAFRPDILHLYKIGQSARDLRPIWMVRITPLLGTPTTTNLRMLIICRQHGDEPVSTEAALRLIHGFVVGQPIAELNRTTLYIIPMANPDGAEDFQRVTGEQADLNRDWGIFSQSETRAIYRAYKATRPQLVVDMHSWTVEDPYRENSIEICQPSDAFSLPVSERAMSLQRQITGQVFQQCGISMNPMYYTNSSDMSLCHRFFAQKKGAVSMLIETAAGGITDDEMEGRIQVDVMSVATLIESMSHERTLWLKLAESNQTLRAPLSVYTMTNIALNRPIAKLFNAPKTVLSQPVVIPHSMLTWLFLSYGGLCLLLVKFQFGQIMRSLKAFFAKLTPNSFPKPEERKFVFVSARQKRYPSTRRLTPFKQKSELHVAHDEIHDHAA